MGKKNQKENHEKMPPQPSFPIRQQHYQPPVAPPPAPSPASLSSHLRQETKQKSSQSSTDNQSPQMVTIKRIMMPNNREPTVTITLKGENPGAADKVLYTLVNGQVQEKAPTTNKKKKNKK